MAKQQEQVLVPVEQLTDDEIEKLALGFEQKARALHEHADELRRYKSLRATGESGDES